VSVKPVSIDYPSTEGAECPFPVYEYWRAEAPVYRLPDRPDVYVISRDEDVRKVARDPLTFSSVGSRVRLNGFGYVGKPTTGDTIVESDPPAHKAKHDLAFKALKPGRIKEHAGWIEVIVDGLIDRFIERGECEFVSEFARRLPVAVTARFFGIPDEDLPLLEQWADLEVSGLSWMPQDRLDRQRRDGLAMGSYLERLVRERSDDPGEDFVSQLIVLQTERDGQADLVEILAIASNVLAGGAATTQHMLGGAMLLLLEHPDQLERCRREPAWIPRVLNEAMRLESSVQWVPRIVMADTEIAGTPIPADSYVLIVFASANRDPGRFQEPDRFDPSRQNVGDQIAFGTGIHSCIGAPLARLEGRIAIERLLARLSNIRVVPGHDIRHVPSPSFRGLEALPIRFDRA
jgi:cytochrome P450